MAVILIAFGIEFGNAIFFRLLRLNNNIYFSCRPHIIRLADIIRSRPPPIQQPTAPREDNIINNDVYLTPNELRPNSVSYRTPV